MPGSSEYDTSGGVQDPAASGPRGPGPHDQIPPNKPPWFDQPHPVAPWGQQQVSLRTCCWGRWMAGRWVLAPVWVHGPLTDSAAGHGVAGVARGWSSSQSVGTELGRKAGPLHPSWALGLPGLLTQAARSRECSEGSPC